MYTGCVIRQLFAEMFTISTLQGDKISMFYFQPQYPPKKITEYTFKDLICPISKMTTRDKDIKAAQR